ncbi:MarR family winged helix-turn-helix transcriptional regulator [Paenibacillus hamazuiensis]|uniref:MarR family winged helix-turn-helix transcriptional regulator n=1 Tax=Paenibacillus hamazuiensis TaxID=2936508 RepID=UPI002010A4EE|nr:MarR family transcriptional regulator [Paenibacillus hamazuiensis]
MNQATEIGQAVRKLARLYTTTTEKLFLNEYKLTKPQTMVIGQIYLDPKTIGQITEAVQLSYSTVSGIIDRLERDGWIQRVRDESDRRVVWIQKTEKFSEIRNTLLTHEERFFTSVLEGLSEEQLDGIAQSLDLLNSLLEKKAGKKS